MAIELKNLKNDTQRKNAIREKLASVIYNAIVEEFGADETVLIKDKITVICDDNDEGSEIAGQTVAVTVGLVNDKNGDEVEAVATISATVKSWNTTKNKSGRITYAMNMSDIMQAIEDGAEERAIKEQEKEKAKEKAKKDREKRLAEKKKKEQE